MEQASLEEPAGSSLRSEKLSSVIDVLPPEILGHIIECTAQPEEARQVLRLTHVSTLWQSITLSYSRLFTNAHWGRWAPQLIQLWCERAKYRSLSIYLDNITLLEISRELGGKAENDVSLPKYQRRLGTLRQAIPYAESLDVESFDEPRREDWHPEDNPLTILCPNLCWLSISSVHIRSEMPLVELNTLIFSDIDTDEAPEVMWPTLYDRIFTLCPAVTDITFTLSTEARIIGPKLSLPKVRRLSLHRRGDENYTFLPYQSMLDLFQFPSLVELSITIDWIPLDDVSGLLVSNLAQVSVEQSDAFDFLGGSSHFNFSSPLPIDSTSFRHI
ncbi:hypothetical protein DL93DRAFT_2086654 [Clavulina sp. PMI_390]|nr:hypothetical protein DL93DRAFT_2086654 [Clavulina sp. PMI_390]